MKQLSLKEKLKIVFMHGQGKKPYTIAKILNRSISQIKIMIERFEDENDPCTRRPGTGKKRKLSYDEENELVELLHANPEKSYQEIQNIMGTSCSRHVLNNYGLKNKISKFFKIKF